MFLQTDQKELRALKTPAPLCPPPGYAHLVLICSMVLRMMWIGLKKNQLQRNYAWKFLQLCNGDLSLDEIKEKVFSGTEETVIDYQI